MTTRLRTLPPALLCAFAIQCAAAAPPAPETPVECEGLYPRHLQGISRDPEGNLYWSWTDVIAKTDAAGALIRRVDADNHQGDLCYHDGRLYVAVNLGRFNRPPGQADSWVYVFDAESLELLRRVPVPELVHGAGGMACDGERFVVIGGLPPEVEENYVYEYDLDLNFVQRHVLPSGYTRLGIQTAVWAHGAWWFGCYGRVVLRTDADFRLDGRWEFNAALGIEEGPEGRFLIGLNTRDPEAGYTGFIRTAAWNEEEGFRFAD